MDAARRLNQRIIRLEDRAVERAAHAEAERLGAIVGCPPDVLLARARELAPVLEQHGREHVVELLARDIGCTPQELEEGAARLARA